MLLNMGTSRMAATQWPSSNPYDLEEGRPMEFSEDDRLNASQYSTLPAIAPPPRAVTAPPIEPPKRPPESCVSSTSTLASPPEDGDDSEKSSSDASTGRTVDVEEPLTIEIGEPSPRYSRHWLNVLRWEWLSTYRRLNLLVIFFNILTVVILAAENRLLSLSPNAMSTALVANITAAIVIRQEYVVNALFLVFGSCPPTWPLWIRRLAGNIYHFGGIHSGAGMASIVWLAMFDMSLGFLYRDTTLTSRDVAIITITILLNLLLVCTVLSSLPRVRERYHNIWEMIHRFGGWLAVALFWVNFGLLADRDRRLNHPSKSVFEMISKNSIFWMLFVITACLVLPWLRLRKVSVNAVYQSQYAIRLHFQYANLALCAAPRLSTSPLTEWHSFAGIPEEDGNGFSVLVSAAGDWTTKMVHQPPKHLWVRGVPVRGVLHVAPIFRKIVLVATGSGIGPVLSLLYARDVVCRILWCTRNPSHSYKPDVVEQVKRADKDAQIIARVKGQPEPHLGKMAYALVHEIGAEAVFVISNKKGCRDTRIWLESRGVVVFSPIFDS